MCRVQARSGTAPFLHGAMVVAADGEVSGKRKKPPPLQLITGMLQREQISNGMPSSQCLRRVRS
jgi:hypothetical protein